VIAGASRAVLPVRARQPEDEALPEFGPPEESQRLELVELKPGAAGRSIRHDLSTGRVELVYDWDVGGLWRMPSNGLEFEDVNTTIFSISEGDPLSARVVCRVDGTFGRGDWRTSARTHTEMTADADAFHITCRLEAFEGDDLAFERTWTYDIPRDLV